MIIKSTPSYTPKCPNHGSPLEDCGFPLPERGVGTCPVSGARFAFEAEVQEEKMVKDKDGNMTKAVEWSVKGND